MNRRQFISRTLAALATSRFAHAIAPTTPATTQSSPMLHRTIPSTGESIPAIGMGTWQTFDPPDTTDATLAPLREVLRIFHEGGGRVVDSSPMYGKAEAITGQLSSELGINRDLFIATKVWTRGEEPGITQMNESLQKLRRDALDLMQIHNLLDWKTHLPTLRKWKEQGRFRYIGVTHYQLSAFDELETIVRNEHIDFVQIPYSIAVRDAEKRLLPAAREAGVAVLVMRPFEGGTLFNDARKKPLPDFAKDFAATWGQAFLKFILAHPAVTCVIPATNKPQHMQDNLAAGAGRLPTEDERQKLIATLAG